MKFETQVEEINRTEITKYQLLDGNKPLSWKVVLKHLQSSPAFSNDFARLLADSPLLGYRLETPALNQSKMDHAFEFVLINEPLFTDRKTDWGAFYEHLAHDESMDGVVSFQNIGGDATLVAPSARVIEDVYGHLASFVREAPPSQVRALWREVARVVESQVGKQPIWLSTAGGGVAWLHVRIDTEPKYYSYSPYRKN